MTSREICSTLTGGIQDISAIPPLLGTEQCSVQVSSALTRGYLYAAATPMSIFGSLGVVTAGFKTLVACFSFGDIEGAELLWNMGFEPQGENLSLIMVEAGKGKDRDAGRYTIETRMDELIKKLNIDKTRITGVSHKSAAWNVKMVATTALLCTLSIAPYIHLNRGHNHLKKSTTWIFPVLRATGGFITATLIQLLIQRRIATLFNEYLKRDQQPKRDQPPNKDIEAAVETKKNRTDANTWPLLFLLLIGLVASVVGYVGCFSVVQNSTSTIGPVSWFCLEAGLSVMRLAIWAWNPTRDDAPPLEIILELDEYEPFPTCNKDSEEILENGVLPLTRARDFLKIITSFAGLIEPFSNPDLSLYYTLTRIPPSKSLIPAEWSKSNNAKMHKPGEWILYITVFDHKERTTRVYTGDNEIDTFYSTKSDAPIVDFGHFLLEVEIDAEIDPKGDPVSSNSSILDLLRNHHRSILELIRYRLGAGNVTKLYVIENSWTMKVEDTISTLQRLRKDNGAVWKTVVEKGKEEERKPEREFLLICDYFVHSSIERERRLLDEKRVKWIARRMGMITKETNERFQGKMEVEYRVNKQAVEKKPTTKSPRQIESMLYSEQCLMELMLLYEVNEWEQLFWIKFKAFRDKIGNDRVGVKERLTREWRADCWRRLDFQMHAALKRLAIFGYNTPLSATVKKKWESLVFISQLFEGVENWENRKSSSNLLSELKEEVSKLGDDGLEIRTRMEKEIEDTEFRLKRGSDLERFDQFWDDSSVFKCRYSQSKWLVLSQPEDTILPLEIYSHALKGNKNIIDIIFDRADYPVVVNRFQDIISDLPRVTSICWNSHGRLPTIHRDRLFVKPVNKDLIAFAKGLKLDSNSTYIFTDADSDDIFYPEKLGNNARVLISFVAPTSGQSLILRLKHSGVTVEDVPLEVTLKSTIIQLNPSSESSLTIDDLTLYPTQDLASESGHLSFVPEIRNVIFIQFVGPFKTASRSKKETHVLHDIELLDEAGLEYSASFIHTV